MIVATALVACGDDQHVCGAVRRAYDACEQLGTYPESCPNNVTSCTDLERERWIDHFNCMQEQCELGSAPMVVDEVCAHYLSGISWGCNPVGPGI